MSKENLLAHIRETAGRLNSDRGVHILGFGTDDISVPYEEFLRMSTWLARRIPDDGQRPKVLVIAADGPLPTLLAFFAGLHRGLWPLILPGPAAGGVDAFLRRIRQTIRTLPGSCVLALEDGLIRAGDFPLGIPVLRLQAQAQGYGTAEAVDPPPAVGGDDVAFLQMTSASTGDAKLVAISHGNACANLTALHHGLGAGPDERMASWLPLHHDMGLVGTSLLSFFYGFPLHLMKPTEFILRPHRWLDALSRFRCTITAAPNFGYDHAQRTIRDRDLEGCDLSALKHAVVGAEPIRLATLHGFHQRFRGYGLRADSLCPSYGMAETAVGTTMVPPGRPPRYLLVDLARTATGQPARILDEGAVGSAPARSQGTRGVAVFSVGPPLPGMDVTVVDDEGRPLHEEDVLGEIALRGPSVSVGYLNPATGRPKPFPNHTHHTGDLGLIHRGELYVLERRKHVIIRQGRNYLASLLEERVGHILGRPAHEILVLDTDIHDPAGDISAIVENSVGPACLSAAQQAAFKELDLPVDTLLFARRRVIPRTTSGKKKYDEARRRLALRTLTVDRELRLAPDREGYGT
ncbi:AMP-binding protein [Streptomyces sp. NPDC058989]|uniref:AMP-binding protein n=1 Tax=Streptomyces sp. NPDC058989 TaxID=3346686 RepID=UPI00368F79C4